MNDSSIDFETAPLREVDFASIDEGHHVVELRQQTRSAGCARC